MAADPQWGVCSALQRCVGLLAERSASLRGLFRVAGAVTAVLWLLPAWHSVSCLA